MPLDVVRLRDSRLAATASGDEFRAAVLLWCASWHQVPASSLPNDDRELSSLAGYGRDVKGWMKVKKMALHGWTEHADSRLYHQVISEKSSEAWAHRQMQRQKAVKRWGNATALDGGNATAYATASPMADATAMQQRGNREGEREYNTTPQRERAPEGGVVEIDQDADESDPVTVTKPQPIQPAAKPVTSFLDWVNAGHPRVQLAGESLILWRGLWDQYERAPNGELCENRPEVFGWMYTALVKTLDQPRFKIWPTAAQEWLMKNCPMPQGTEA